MQHPNIEKSSSSSRKFSQTIHDLKKIDTKAALSPKTPPAITAALLSENLFPPRKPTIENAEDEDSEEKKKEDPLATQVWRLYTKAKDTLPNGSRLENLTWRMMAMTLNKKKKAEEEEEAAAAIKAEEEEYEDDMEQDLSPPPPDDTTTFLSSSAPPYMLDFMGQHNNHNNVMIYGSARASTNENNNFIYGTNSITIPADMDTTDDNTPVSPLSTTSSSFHPSTSFDQQFNNSNYFSQSVPIYHHPSIQQSPTGLFPQLGSNLPHDQGAAFFGSTPNENTPSPANAGALSFEELLTMYYVNNNNNNNNVVTPPALMMNNSSSSNVAHNFQLPPQSSQPQGT